MGSSANGIITFGFDIGEDRPLNLIRKAAREGRLALNLNCSIEKIEDMYTVNELALGEAGLSAPSWSDAAAYHEYKQKRETVLASYPVEDVTHCGSECRMYVIAVRGTQKMAYFGESLPFDPAELSVSSEQIAALKAWCERYGIQYREPSWLLLNYYG